VIKYFPKHNTPRPIQVSALEKLERVWNSARVIVLNLPTGSGKSAIAYTIARKTRNAAIITPTKLLVDQYGQEYKSRGLNIMKGKNSYFCTNLNRTLDKRGVDLSGNTLCGPLAPRCDGCDNYREDKYKAEHGEIIAGNYFTYLAYKLFRENLIVDEAHKLIEAIQSMEAKKVWKFKAGYPASITDRWKFREWLKDRPEVPGVDEKLREDLYSRSPSLLFNRSLEDYRGREEDCISMAPLDVTDATPWFWPDSVKRIILMSATINSKDIEQLGLSRHKVAYISEDSPIKKCRRPVVVPAWGGINMSLRYAEANLTKLITACQAILTFHKGEKGLIHCSYGLANKIKHSGWQDSRLLYHTKEDKTEQYQLFRQSDPKDGACLVASGMYEGIDLPYEYGRWQIIAKVPWPYLGEPAIKAKAEVDPDFYIWETVKTLLQACGRIVRSPDDYGLTYILDSTFKRLYTQHTEMFPLWFQKSVKFVDTQELKLDAETDNNEQNISI